MSAPASYGQLRRARTAAVAAVALFAAVGALHACRTSPDPRRAALADPQRGAVVGLRLLDDRRHRGELLAVEESTLVLLTGSNRVAVGRLAEVARVDWSATASTRDFGVSIWTSPALRRRARLASRFPYGIPDPVMRTLLAGLRQSAPDTLRAVVR